GAAVNLLVAVFCRTTKEANSALRYLTFVPMLAGMFVVFFPSRAGQAWFALPIVGQQVLIGLREPSIAHAVVLALVTVIATALALGGASRVLTRDDILAA